MKTEISERIKKLRVNANLSIKELSEKLNVSCSTIYRWESSGKIRVRHLILLSRFYNVRANYILCLE